MFKSINGICYAFENVRRTFQATQTRCGQIFGNQIGGKIFEPRSTQVMQEINKYALISWDGVDPQTWLGITDESSEGNFVYPSDGQSHKLSSFRPQRSNSRSANCIFIHPSYTPSNNYMYVYKCTHTNPAAICEWVI